MEAKFPILNTTDIFPGQFNKWSEESHQIAHDFVYNDFYYGEVPSIKYQKKAQPILKKRMVLGSRRLAELIKDIYGEEKIDLES